MKLFCYGTLQQPKTQLELIGRELIGHISSLDGYIILRDYIDPEDGIPYPRIVEHKFGCVFGTVLEFTEDEIKIIDKYETDMYCRTTITTNCGELVEIYLPSYKQETYKLLK
jgi:gamma-glutamylcyclotransferase (GGCT)/AIG2-like uncharacterized protein YtfP